MKVVDGNFRVQLVPTTDSNPPTYYTVKYNSDGKIQFQETWVVGAASTAAENPRRARFRLLDQPLHAAQPDVRSRKSDVVGLTGDLGFAAGERAGVTAAGLAAVISSDGGIEAVIGNPSDCVLVDGTSGPCGREAAAAVRGWRSAGR